MNDVFAYSDETAATDWVFGYGSLIYKVDFPYRRKEVASISGWERRFWQGSHDHRGTPEAPGRVVTLIPSPGTLYAAGTDNPAFLGPADPAEMADQILAAHGPSGSNREYLLELDKALREIGETDLHVAELARRIPGNT